jgi:Arc/MetJ-type ribon-helix-helix transcriptional regulator
MRQILNISLPVEMVKSIKEEVKEGQFSSVSEFIRHLVRVYNTEKLARELKRDSKLFRQGKLKVFEVKSLKDLL